MTHESDGRFSRRILKLKKTKSVLANLTAEREQKKNKSREVWLAVKSRGAPDGLTGPAG